MPSASLSVFDPRQTWGVQSARLLGNAFDEVAAYFGELLGFGPRCGGCGTIEPLLRLFQAIERNNCNLTPRRSLSGCNLPAKNDVSSKG